MKTAGALAAAGATGMTGCLGEGGASDEKVVWEHSVGGRIDAVHDGKVYGREDWREGGKRSAFALDAVDGNGEWTYGEIGGSSTYTPLVVDGGVYFGYGDDEVGSGAGDLYALEEDGGERWVRDIGSVYDAPVVRDGVVYAGSDRGAAHAFDAVTGDELWSRGFESPEEYATPAVEVEAVEDGVAYVTVYGNLYAIEKENGDDVWRYDGTSLAGGYVYAVTDERAHRIDDGEVVSSTVVPGDEGANSHVIGDDGTVYVGTRGGIYALSL